MRIALLIEKLTDAGGAERMASYLAAGLDARGHEVHVYATGFDSTSVTKHPLPGGGHVKFARQCAQALENDHFDVVHSFTRTISHDILRLGGGIHAEYLRRMEPARSLLGRFWSRINPKERLILDLERLGLEKARLVQAVSHRVKREAVEHYGIDPERVVVMHNGVDTRRFHPGLREGRPQVLRELQLPSDALVCLFVGSGSRRKGLAAAVAAIDLVPDPSVHLIVVGRAPHVSASPRTRLVGPRRDVERFYGAADVLILPTLYDPFPNVCMEAMASGVPVIVTRVAGVSEIITDGVDSFVVEDGTAPNAIAAHIRHLVRSQERETMRRAARALAERHTIDRYVEDTIGMYVRFVESRPPSPRTG